MTLNDSDDFHHPEVGPHDLDLEGEFFKLIGPDAAEIIQAAKRPETIHEMDHLTLSLAIPAKYVRSFAQALALGDGAVLRDLLYYGVMPVLQEACILNDQLWEQGIDIERYIETELG